MRHDLELTDRLAGFPTEAFAGVVFRATRQSLDPLAFSSRGGRWAPAGDIAVLYSSLDRDGALAEIAFHWGKLTPLPTKPATLHELRVGTSRSLRLVLADLVSLGLDAGRLHEPFYARTQQIGAAVAFIGCDGLLVPSARWDCFNLVLFNDNHTGLLELSRSESVDWQQWAREHGVELDPEAARTR